MNEPMKLACFCFWFIINSSSSSWTKDSNKVKNKADDKKHKFQTTVLRENKKHDADEQLKEIEARGIRNTRLNDHIEPQGRGSHKKSYESFSHLTAFLLLVGTQL